MYNTPTRPPQHTRQYFVKPFVARKQRFDRWSRRRSMEKINGLLGRVRYDKAR